MLAETSANRGLQVNLAINYGGRAELVDAVKALVEEARRGEVTAESIDEAAISAHLYTAGMPDPDLLIRTSGEMRVSNFLLWQIAYAELYVTETLWPDFTRADLLGGHVGGRRLGFGDIPGGSRPVLIDVGGVVAGGGVPDDGQGLADQGERDGGPDRAGGAVAGLPGAEDLPGVLERDLDGPSRRVSLDDIGGAGGQVRGDEGKVVAVAGAVADEDDLDRPGAEDGVPQAGDGCGLHRDGFPVAGHGDRREAGCRGESGQGGQPGALDPGPSAAAGARRRQLVQGGVLSQPGRPGHAVRQRAEFFPGVGSIGHHADDAARQGGGQVFGHAAGQPQPGL